jgi:hypothetical protein
MGTSTSDATPAHVITFLEDFSHSGTFLTPEGPRCAPGSLDNQIGYLRKGLALYAGRTGPYEPDGNKGTCPAKLPLLWVPSHPSQVLRGNRFRRR